MEPVLANIPMRGWSILTTIENSSNRNGPRVGDTEAINAGCLGRKGDPYSAKVPNEHLVPPAYSIVRQIDSGLPGAMSFRIIRDRVGPAPSLAMSAMPPKADVDSEYWRQLRANESTP